ncbi:hypothetical protein AY599_27160 [Leptolyngbya valderiana BDU 20041]|nr:hypothetical protein [Geitlerinema sp. CS-897]OAB62731.1 hypothetical protein AY599_27160 [Leptolyngbya valderiana BDU 20041]PPT06798.1 hypothetical protein CKA32_006928 [Geitlerinema sp. FC II]
MLESSIYPWDGFDTASRWLEGDRTAATNSTIARVERQGSTDRTYSSLLPACVRLDFEGLERFEVVRDQFARWGVQFDNAIAVCPSNPAYPTHSGEILLMGAPQNGFLELKFSHPVQFVSGFITSSRITAMSAYNHLGETIARAELPSSNLADSKKTTPPNYQLIVKAPNIHRVTFYAFDGELAVDDISFGY